VEAKRTADGPKREFKNQHRATAVVWRRVAELKPDPRNPREHSQKQIRQIARSIEAFGFNVLDPPYNVPIEGNVSGFGKIHHREFAMARGEMSDDEFANFLTEAFILLVRYSAPGSIHFIFMDWRHLAQVLAAGLGAYSISSSGRCRDNLYLKVCVLVGINEFPGN
jgi:hypothetical protein